MITKVVVGAVAGLIGGGLWTLIRSVGKPPESRAGGLWVGALFGLIAFAFCRPGDELMSAGRVPPGAPTLQVIRKAKDFEKKVLQSKLPGHWGHHT